MTTTMIGTTTISQKFCTGCNSTIAADNKYCAYCGAVQETDVQETTTNVVYCGNCGTSIDREGATYCPDCGHARGKDGSPVTVPVIIETVPAATAAPAPTPRIDRVTAGLFALLLGSIGVQHFYMGRIGAGIASIIFCWTGIPALIGLIQGIVYLTCSDEEFQREHVPK